MTTFLKLHNEEEHNDLVDWMENHDAKEASDWLCTFEPAEYPATIIVLDDLVAPIEEAIADWGEVLSAHREEFQTRTTS